MRYSIILSILILSCLFIWIGCSNQNQFPTSPTVDQEINIDSVNPAYSSEFDSNGNPIGGMGTLGYFTLNVNPQDLTAEITPLRQNSITDVLEIIDITNFMQVLPCTNCVKVNSVGLNSDNYMVVNIGIKHPFPVGDPADPITGRNRADLHVFNVEGIVISNFTGQDFAGLSQSTPGFYLVNAHGYTDYLDASIDAIFPTSASVHPYITHFRTYTQGNFNASNPMGFESVVSPPPSGYLVMPMGSDYDYRDYIFDIPEPMNFIFAVGCTYAVTTSTFEDRFTPEYRCPQHNKKAASEVYTSITSNDLKGGVTTSTAQMQIAVIDISNEVAVGTALNQMFKDSSVSSIKIEIPGVMTDVFTIPGFASVSGTGHSPSDPLMYNMTITNTGGADEGTYTGLIKVLDSYEPGQNTHPFIGENDGGKRVNPGKSPLTGLFEISEFATYQVFNLGIGAAPLPPVARVVTTPDPPRIIQNATITLDATSSSDSDGTIVLYEFDWVWDGTQANFNTDVSNTSGIATSDPYPDSGDYKLGVRVTDNESFNDYTIIHLHVNFPPVADLATIPDTTTPGQYDIFTLDATLSNDPDGDDISYDFDLDWDGNPANFTADVPSTTGIHEFRLMDSGTYTIGLRNIDSDGIPDYDSVTIDITPRDNIVFVDDDNTAGPWDGTMANPYQYIQDGVDAASSDYYVWVFPGTYNEDPTGDTTSGEAEITINGMSNLTLYGEGLPNIVLHEYDDSSDRAGIKATSCPGLTIDGFAFTPDNFYRSAIWIEGSNGSTIQNCTIAQRTLGLGGFFFAEDCNDVIFRYNVIYRPSVSMRMDVPGMVSFINCSDPIITLNYIRSLRFEAVVGARESYALIYCSASPNAEISKNSLGSGTLSGGPDDELMVIDISGNSDGSVIRNNLITGITRRGTAGSDCFMYGIHADSALNVELYNNTLDSIGASQGTSYSYGIHVNNLTTPDIYNNILTNITSDNNAYGIFMNTGAALTVDYCDVWNVVGEDVSERFHNVTEGTHGLDADPSYYSIPFGDFRIVDDSRCKHGGKDGAEMGCYGGDDPLP